MVFENVVIAHTRILICKVSLLCLSEALKSPSHLLSCSVTGGFGLSSSEDLVAPFLSEGWPDSGVADGSNTQETCWTLNSVPSLKHYPCCSAQFLTLGLREITSFETTRDHLYHVQCSSPAAMGFQHSVPAPGLCPSCTRIYNLDRYSLLI